MKFKYIFILLIVGLGMNSCTIDQFDEVYADPEKVAVTTIERQYTGFLNQSEEYIVPNYFNYFVNFRITLNPWTQSIAWINAPNQYVPGSAATDAVWNNYYNIMRQYREFEKVYDGETAERQEALKIFRQTALVHMCYETSIMVDLFENIPFFEAGRLSQNGGDYNNSYPAFDQGSAIYTYMLDELKAVADDFAANAPSDAAILALEAQDIVNNGDFDLWKRYANSLRLRLLNRVSLASDFSSRANSEIAEILGNSGKYPLVESNDQNIMIDVFDINSSIRSNGFNGGINSGGWDGDDASKPMIDFLKETGDPRLAILFEPGDSSMGEFIGIDPTALGNDQEQLRATFVTAFYNRTTTSLNQFIPGVIVNAAEVSLIAAEHYLRSGDDGAAKEAYEASFKQSTEHYIYVNSLNPDRTSGELEPVTDEHYADVFASEAAGWDNASSLDDKIALIAHQKWIHFNIMQPYQNWAEVRRLNYPELEFWVDGSSIVTTPPMRFNIPGKEITFNETNYNAVKDQDQLGSKIFWDVD